MGVSPKGIRTFLDFIGFKHLPEFFQCNADLIFDGSDRNIHSDGYFLMRKLFIPAHLKYFTASVGQVVYRTVYFFPELVCIYFGKKSCFLATVFQIQMNGIGGLLTSGKTVQIIQGFMINGLEKIGMNAP